MVSNLLIQQALWDTGLMHYVPSTEMSSLHYSNYPSHKYMDWTLILRSHIVIYLIHLLGQITPSIFHTVLKPNLLLRYLKAFRILVNNWHLFYAGLSLSITNAVADQPLWFLLLTRSAITIRKRGKKGLILTDPANYTTYLGPHSEVEGREIESVRGP